jgi:phosphate-selective porin
MRRVAGEKATGVPHTAGACDSGATPVRDSISPAHPSANLTTVTGAACRARGQEVSWTRAKGLAASSTASGGIKACPGAWQVGVRYSHVDLNNRGINGGLLDDLTVGLNWILNPKAKIQWNDEWVRRHGIDAPSNGDMHAFGMRMQFDF